MLPLSKAPFPIDVLFLYCSPLSNARKAEFPPEDGELKLMNAETDDLKYALRSVYRNIPWFNQVYIVIADDDELPVYLRKRHSRLCVVRHSEIIPAQYLPTFNSNVIESYVHKIPGLAEQFIYLNDDMFVCKPTSWRHFYTKRGLPINRHYTGPLHHNVKRASDIMYVKMMQNAIKKYGMSYSRFQHQAFPYKKSIISVYATKFRKAVQETSVHRYRHARDFNLLRFSGCFTSTHGLAGKVIHTLENYDMFLEASEDVKMKQIMEKKTKKPRFLCINNTDESHKHVYKFLEYLFSEPSCFEKMTVHFST